MPSTTSSTYSFASPRSSLPPLFSSRRASTASSSTYASTSASSFSAFAPSSSTSAHPPSLSGPPAPSTPTYSLLRTARGSLLSPTSASATATASDPSLPPAPTSTAPPDLLDRPRDKTRHAELSHASLSFLVAEMVAYTQARVTGIADLEKRLSLLGYHVGARLLPLTLHRQEMATNPKNPRRETRLLNALLWIHGAFWKAAFGRQADSLERSTEAGRGDEYMISTNTPTFSRSISIPKEMSQLSVEAITAGMVEAALDGLGFPARVTAHSVPTPEHPHRTTILIKLDKSVMEREEALTT